MVASIDIYEPDHRLIVKGEAVKRLPAEGLAQSIPGAIGALSLASKM